MMSTEYEDNGHSDEAEPEAILPSRDVLCQARLLFTHLDCETRLAILLVLERDESYVQALCNALNSSQSAISHHLALLKHGGIICPRRDGMRIYYSLTDKGRILAEIIGRVVA